MSQEENVVNGIWHIGCKLLENELYAQALQAFMALRLENSDIHIPLVTALKADIVIAEILLHLSNNNEYVTRAQTYIDHAQQNLPHLQTISNNYTWRIRFIKCKWKLLNLGNLRDAVMEKINILFDGLEVSKSAGVKEDYLQLRSYLLSNLKTLYLSGLSSDVFNQAIHHAGSSAQRIKDRNLQLLLVLVKLHSTLHQRDYVDSSCTNALEFCDKLSTQIQVESMNSATFSFGEANLLRYYSLVLKIMLYLRMGEYMMADKPLQELHQLVPTAADELGRMSPFQWKWISPYCIELTAQWLTTMLQNSWDPQTSLSLSGQCIESSQKVLLNPSESSEDIVFANGVYMSSVSCRVDCFLLNCRYKQASECLYTWACYVENLDPNLLVKDNLRFQRASIHKRIAQLSMSTGNPQKALDHLRIVGDLFPSSNRFLDEKWIQMHLEVALVAIKNRAPISMQNMENFQLSSNMSSPTPSQLHPQLYSLAKEYLRFPGLKEAMKSCQNKYLRTVFNLVEATCVINSGNPNIGGNQASASYLLPLLRDAVLWSSESLRNSSFTARLMVLLGPILLSQGQSQEGQDALNQALRIAIHLKDLELQVNVLYVIYFVYSTTNTNAASQDSMIAQLNTISKKWRKKLCIWAKRREEGITRSIVTSEVHTGLPHDKLMALGADIYSSLLNWNFQN